MRWLDFITNSMYEFDQILGDSEGQGAWHAAWDHKELDTT